MRYKQTPEVHGPLGGSVTDPLMVYSLHVKPLTEMGWTPLPPALPGQGRAHGFLSPYFGFPVASPVLTLMMTTRELALQVNTSPVYGSLVAPFPCVNSWAFTERRCRKLGEKCHHIHNQY